MDNPKAFLLGAENTNMSKIANIAINENNHKIKKIMDYSLNIKVDL